jgi:hypothetical protein
VVVDFGHHEDRVRVQEVLFEELLEVLFTEEVVELEVVLLLEDVVVDEVDRDRLRVQDEDLVYLEVVLVDEVEEDVVVGLTQVLVLVGKGGHMS